jgi:sugar phosphate isomerase/epimerase
MNRRDFLAGSAGLALGAGLAGRGWAQRGPDPKKLERVAIMTWSFDQVVKGRQDDSARPLDLLDIPAMYADRYGVHNVEVQSVQFSSVEPGYLQELKKRLASSRSRITNMNLEFQTTTLSSPDKAVRFEAVDLARAWIDRAVVLGSPRVMVNQGTLTEQNEPIAIAALKQIGDYAKSKGIKVGMEPRGGGGTAPAGQAPFAWIDLMAEVIQGAGTYANLDIGNFGDQEAQHYGIRKMLPMSHGSTHVKLNPARYDLPAALRLMQGLGYTGLYSIEGGTQGDPYENVQKIFDVLVANL